MVTYDDFSKFSNISVTQADFPYMERTSVDLLSCLCRTAWDEDNEVCKKAVMYQIEFIAQSGGLNSWSTAKGVIGSQSYTIGGENESVTYIQSKSSENAKTFNGLAISPLAWALLTNNGILKTARGVRVW